MDSRSDSLDRPGGDSLSSLDPSIAAALRALAAAPALATERDAGSQVGGHYTLEDRLGRGGMGVVYRAHDRELDRQVAIKFHSAITDPRAAESLLQEARAMARLAHPNVITVYEVGGDAGQIFIAMEWVDGVDLRRWLAQPRRWREVVEHFLAAGEGLAAAHRVGLVHRDFKPSNVLIGKDGRVRVADFGLAARTGPASGERAAKVGTPGYAAPEQLGGAVVDARSDQYSYCVALYEALHGRRPAVGEVVALAQARAARRDLPARLQRALLRGLEPEPAARFADMPALLAALRQALAGRRRWLAAALLGLAACVGVAVGATTAPGGVRCAEAAWATEELWPAARREALAERFAGLGLGDAAMTWVRVAATLDAYVAGLTGAAVEACRDSHERGVQSSALLDLRMACLVRARRELDARVEELGRVDRETLDSAIALASSLPPLAACADPQRLRAETRVVAPKDAGRLAALEATLARARSRLIAGAGPEARWLATSISDELAALAVPGLIAEQQEIVGKSLLLEHATAEARERFEAGYLGARAAGDEVHAARLSLELANLLARYAARFPDALFWTQLARAELGRAGAEVAQEVDLMLIEGAVRAGLDDQEAALRSYDAAAELLRRRGSARPDHMAAVQSNRGIALELLGRFDAAVAAQKAALAVVQAELGPQHPKNIDVLNLVGTALDTSGRPDEAQGYYEAALELADRLYPGETAVKAVPLANLAVLHGDQQRYAQAIPLLERALAIHEHNGVPNPVYLATTLSMLGSYRAFAGDPRAGLPLLDRALAIELATFGADHPRFAECRMMRAEVLAAGAGPLEEALREQLAAGAALERALGPDELRLADSLTAAAELLLQLGRVDEAEASVRRALAIWARVDPEHPRVERPRDLLQAVQAARAGSAAGPKP